MIRHLLVIVLMSACTPTNVEVVSAGDLEQDLDRALEKWAGNEPTKYRFAYVFSDSAGIESPEVEVSVENGVAVPSGMTVTDLLAYVAEWKVEYSGEYFEARYHSELGYPIEFRTTVHKQFKSAESVDHGFRITEFEYVKNAN